VMRALLATLVATACGLSLYSVAVAEAADLEHGHALFRQQCQVCHGPRGRGDGPVAEFLDPRPRNFKEGLYKLRSTESGELPTDADLVATISKGMHGTAMPSFAHLGEASILDVVEFVKTLGGPENEEGSWFDLYDVPPATPVPPAPAVTAESKAKGEQLYTKMGCDGCHGKTGKGDGKKPEEMLDQWGRPTHPRSFHLGVFKGGNDPRDIYLRIMTGLDGSPMTGFWKDVMTPEERWTLVQLVLGWAPKLELEQPGRGSLRLSEAALPSKADDPAWEAVSASAVARLALDGGWLGHFAPLEVKGLSSSDELALRVSWDDGVNTCAILRVSFPESHTEATFELGSEQLPLRVWQWSEGQEPRVLVARGAGSEEPLDLALRADALRKGERRTVMLSGKLPSSSKQVLIGVSGCKPEGNYVTASTFYDLR